MKMRLNKMMIAACIGLIMSILVTNTSPMYTVIEAATKKKVVTVVGKEKQKDGRYKRVTLYGKAKDGSVVWKYTSKYKPLTELDTNEFFVNDKFVYLFSDKLYAISKATGKVKWTYDCSLGGVSTAFDKKGNIYFTGFYYDYVHCISPEGKLKFKTKIPDRYYWPYEIKISGNKILVYIDGDSKEETSYYKEKHYLTFDKKGNYIGFDTRN